jgi:hypothetical protein
VLREIAEVITRCERAAQQQAAVLHSIAREMEGLAHVSAGDRSIECGVATTSEERTAVHTHRFRVYQRRGYYRPNLQADRELYDDAAISFLALDADPARSCSGARAPGRPLRWAQVLVEHAFGFELPEAIAKTTVSERMERTRGAPEAVRGIAIGELLVPLGLIEAFVNGAASGTAWPSTPRLTLCQ